MIDIDTQYGGEQARQVLSGRKLVGWIWRRRVARCDVEASVATEREVAAVMTALQPSDKNLFALGINARRIRVEHAKSGDPRAILELLARRLRSERITDETESVLSKLRMKRKPIDSLDTLGPSTCPLIDRTNLGR